MYLGDDLGYTAVMLLTVAEFPYPKNTPAEVMSEDSQRLLRAMKKKYPNCMFDTYAASGVMKLQVTGASDFQRVSMTYFAEGFMASAHLWER